MKRKLTQQYLKQLLEYDPDTGIFRWRKAGRGIVRPERIAGHKNVFGYVIIGIDRETYPAHRLAWVYMNGEWPSNLDHINGNKVDNRIANLRQATKRQNAANVGRRVDNTSGFKGVSFIKRLKGTRNPWLATMAVNGKSTYLGYFETKEAAAEAYMKAAKEHFGEFARID